MGHRMTHTSKRREPNMIDVREFNLKPETVEALEQLDELGPCACTASTSCDEGPDQGVSK